MILEKAADYFRGSAVLRIEKRYESGFLRMLLSERVPARVYELYENGEKYGIEAVISPKFIKNIVAVLDKYSIKVYIINIKGFCTLIPNLRHRIGVAAGAVLFFALLWLSTLFLWRVEIVGAENVSENALRGALAEAGVTAGAVISDIDAFSVSNALLLTCPEISWASLQLKGTTATLTVRETVAHQNVKKNQTPLLVASESGVIESILVYEGAAAVKPGCVVKAGDALINGLISGSGLQYSEQPVLRIGNADGSVKALVEREFSVTVPYREIRLITKEDGRNYRGKRVNLFGNGFYVGDRISDSDGFAVSVTQTSPTVFGATLPITVYETVWSELTESEIIRSPEEAEALAQAEAEKALSEALGTDEATFTEYTVLTDIENGAVTVKVRYRCITEIAVSADIGNAD